MRYDERSPRASALDRRDSGVTSGDAASRARGLCALGALAAVVMSLPLRAQTIASPLTPATAAKRVPLVVRDVTVIDVRDGKRVPNQTVAIVGNRIRAVGSAATVPAPAGARVVDGRGKYLIPGLWDLHVHPMQYVDISYPLFIANGVTGVRDAGSTVPLATFTRWKEEIAAGERVGPRLIVSGHSIDGPCQPNGGFLYTHMICVSTPDEARQIVDQFQTAGADMIKTYLLSPELYYAIAAEARRIGIPFGGHAYVGGLAASDSGAVILDHETWFNPNVCGDFGEPNIPRAPSLEACTAAAQQLRRNGTWVSVMRFSPMIRMDLDSTYMPYPMRGAFVETPTPFRPTSTADWGKWDTTTSSKESLERMRAAGVPMVVGTDASATPEHADFCVPGFCVAEVMASLVLKAGMTPLEALQTATLNPASAMKASDSLGTIDAGKVADLVLLDADPLVDVWNTTKIRGVVANGRYYDRAALDGLLRSGSAAAHRYRQIKEQTQKQEPKAP